MANDDVKHGDNRPAADMIKNVVERIERLHEEKKSLSDDVADIYREAKSCGLDAAAIRIVVRRRAQDKDKLRELDALVEMYEEAAGG